MAKVKFSGGIAKKILIALAGVAGVTGVAALTVTLAVMPGLGLVVKEILDWYKSQDSRKQEQIRKTFVEMRRERLIIRQRLSGGSTAFVLSKKGKEMLFKHQLDDLAIKKPQSWDGRWRFVIFDFPKRYNKEREYFRNKLKRMGFYLLQKSVWLHPFPCDEEIVQISEYLKVERHVRLIEAIDFDGNAEIKDFFF